MAENSMMMDWNDSIENDGKGFVVLEEGDYNFTVTNFERGRHPGSEKIPACNKAIITMQVATPAGEANVKTDLILYRSMEWKLSAFFRCIGQKKHGERLTMNWNKVIGSKGRAHFKPRTYVDKDNKERQANDFAYFIDYDPAFFNEPEWVHEAELAGTASWEQGTF